MDFSAKRILEVKKELFSTQDLVLNIKDLEGSSIHETESNAIELKTLREQLMKLEKERDEQSNLCNLATRETQRLILIESNLFKDIDNLNSALFEIQQSTDLNALAGTLQLEILSLKRNGITQHQEIQDLLSNESRLENIIASQEKEISDLERFVFDVRINAKKYSLFLKKCLNNVNCKSVGMVPLEQYEVTDFNKKLRRANNNLNY